PKSSCAVCEEITFARTCPSASITAAQVSSQLVSSARMLMWLPSHGARVGHVLERPQPRGGGAPHHEGVLAVVLVVAAPGAGGAKALALVQVDGDGVRAANLEREASALVADARVELGEQARGQADALAMQVDGDVHHVPDGVVARA